jgi:hypothetical protein
MALANVLSAVRELILANGALPNSVAERTQELARRFPTLSDRERADLAAISPGRLEIYTNLVLDGEVTMLEWAFPMSMAALRRLAGCGEGEHRAFDRDLLRRMQQWRSWRSDSTRELAELFADYVKTARRDLLTAWAGLGDLIELERTALHVFYAEDAPAVALDPQELLHLSVGELMDCSIVVPEYVTAKAFNHDVVDLAAHWQRDKSLPLDWPGESSTLAVCGRSVETLLPIWLHLTSPGHAALQAVGHRKAPISTMAEGFVAATPPEDQADEASLFQRFYALLAQWRLAGVILKPVV